jgi:hypothetical protein
MIKGRTVKETSQAKDSARAIECSAAHERAPTPVIEVIELLVFRDASNPMSAA